MSLYKRVLIALDFQGDNAEVIRKGKALAAMDDSLVYLLHVNEPLGIAYGADGMSWSDQVAVLESSIRKQAREKMAETGKQLEISEERCLIREGRPSAEIHAVAEEQKIDLIVMGTHGQAGLKLLLGSTANSVLHGATCDVLAVRIDYPEDD